MRVCTNIDTENIEQKTYCKRNWRNPVGSDDEKVSVCRCDGKE
jgi:hypothetical protein